MAFAGGIFPEGLPKTADQLLLCQRFDKHSTLGRVFGGKHVFYTTLYDSNKRMPILAAIKTSSLGDQKWPHPQWMLERSKLFYQISRVS